MLSCLRASVVGGRFYIFLPKIEKNRQWHYTIGCLMTQMVILRTKMVTVSIIDVLLFMLMLLNQKIGPFCYPKIY